MGDEERLVSRFEELIAWQKARLLTREVYTVTRNTKFSADHGLSRQIQRAAVSVMSNIAEGYERANPNEFLHFLNIAKGSCAEVRSQLVVAYDIGYIDTDCYNQMMRLAEETGRVIGGLRQSIIRKRTGQKL